MAFRSVLENASDEDAKNLCSVTFSPEARCEVRNTLQTCRSPLSEAALSVLIHALKADATHHGTINLHGFQLEADTILRITSSVQDFTSLDLSGNRILTGSDVVKIVGTHSETIRRLLILGTDGIKYEGDRGYALTPMMDVAKTGVFGDMEVIFSPWLRSTLKQGHNSGIRWFMRNHVLTPVPPTLDFWEAASEKVLDIPTWDPNLL